MAHLEQPAIGDGAAVGIERLRRAAPSDEGPIIVDCDARLEFVQSHLVEASTQHIDDAIKARSGQAVVGVAAAEYLIRLVGVPGLLDDHRHNDLGE